MLRIRGAIPPLPQYVFMEWCLDKHRDNLNLTLTMLRRVVTPTPPPPKPQNLYELKLHIHKMLMKQLTYKCCPLFGMIIIVILTRIWSPMETHGEMCDSKNYGSSCLRSTNFVVVHSLLSFWKRFFKVYRSLIQAPKWMVSEEKEVHKH